MKNFQVFISTRNKNEAARKLLLFLLTASQNDGVADKLLSDMGVTEPEVKAQILDAARCIIHGQPTGTKPVAE